MASQLTTRADVPDDKLLGALNRYRILAFITGAWLLLLCVEMVAKYVFLDGEQWLGAWVSYAHGWVYVVYLITVFDLYNKVSAPLSRLARLIIAGVIPLLSFVEEHRTYNDVVKLVSART